MDRRTFLKGAAAAALAPASVTHSGPMLREEVLPSWKVIVNFAQPEHRLVVNPAVYADAVKEWGRRFAETHLILQQRLLPILRPPLAPAGASGTASRVRRSRSSRRALKSVNRKAAKPSSPQLP